MALATLVLLQGCGSQDQASLTPDPHSAIVDRSPWPGFPIERGASISVPFKQDGSQAFLLSANAGVSGSTLVLPSTSTAEYGMFRWNTNGDPLISLAVSKSPPPSATYYVGIANYTKMRWEISGPYTAAASVNLSAGGYTSPGGNCYAFVAAFGGPSVTIQSLTLTADSSLPTFSLSGTITLGGVGEAGVSVGLGGDSVSSTVTDNQGNYSFEGLVNGNYTVTPSKAGLNFGPPTQNTTIAGANRTGVNFTATASQTTFVVSGRVADAGSAGIPGVTMTLTGLPAVQTDAAGNFTINGVANGSYTLVPSKTDYTFNPVNRPVNISGLDLPNQNFTGELQGAAVTYETGLGQIKILVGTAAASCKCHNCHTTQTSGGANFSTYANITANGAGGMKVYQRIIVRAVDSEQMPPAGPKLTAAEKQLLRDWVNAGAPQ